MPTPTRPVPRRPVGTLLLARARPERVRIWAGRGLLSVNVTGLGPWSAVTPASDRAQSAVPYDDAPMALAARPLPSSLRPSITFVVAGLRRRCVHPAPRVAHREAVGGLAARGRCGPGARSAAGACRRPHRRHRRGSPRDAGVVGTLKDVPRDAVTWLAGVHHALRLPGRDLLVDPDAALGTLVEPDPESVARYDGIMREEAAAYRRGRPSGASPGIPMTARVVVLDYGSGDAAPVAPWNMSGPRSS